MKDLEQSSQKVSSVIETRAREMGLPFAIAVVNELGTPICVRYAPPSAAYLVSEAVRKAACAVKENRDTIFRKRPLPGGLVIRRAHLVIGGIGVAGLNMEDQHLADVGRRCFLGQKLCRHEERVRCRT